MAESKKLSVGAWATTASIFWGLYLFFAALLVSANIEILWFSNKIFDLVSSMYPGVTASVVGSMIGLIWGLICGAICGGLFAWVHNLVLNKSFK